MGGFAVDNPTLIRFFSLHFMLPFLIAGMSIVHLLFLHQTGRRNPLGLNRNFDKISFHPYFSLKDLFGFFVILFIFSRICFFYPWILGDPENFLPANPLVTPVHIKPEWYFLMAYAILRCIPSKTLRVLALAAAVAVPIVLAVGYTSTATVSFALIALTFSLLTVVGGMAIVKHYFLMSQCLSLMYFFLVTILS